MTFAIVLFRFVFLTSPEWRAKAPPPEPARWRPAAFRTDSRWLANLA
jgi:hypothetical protein